MQIRILFLSLLFIAIILPQNIFAQNDSLKLNAKRIYIVGSSLAGALGASYWYVQNSWWSEQQSSFHFDDGADLIYALNVDKGGHFMGGLISANVFSSSMKWAGMNTKESLWYGAVFGSGLQLAIELKDAYAPYWGFSKWDLAWGSVGSFWPVAQYYNNNLTAINFKFSYYKHSDIYWQLEALRGKEISKYAWQDDYPNQTYWATFEVNHFVQTCCWPDWLDVAIGFGLDETQYLNQNNTKMGGNNEWYLALDYDIASLLKGWDSQTGRKVKKWLNYIHFPAPTIRIYPKVDFYFLFL